MKSAEQVIEEMLEEDRLVEEASLETCMAVLAAARSMQDEAEVRRRVGAMLLDRCGPRLGRSIIRLLDDERSWREYGRVSMKLLDMQDHRLFLALKIERNDR